MSGFRNDGLEAYIEDAPVDGRIWFRLYIGPYASRDLADAKGLEMKRRGIIDYFLVTELDQTETGS